MSFTPAKKRPVDIPYNTMLTAVLNAATEGVGVVGGVDDAGNRWLKIVFPPVEES